MVKADQMMRQKGVLYFGFRQRPTQQIACHNPFPRLASQFLKVIVLLIDNDCLVRIYNEPPSSKIYPTKNKKAMEFSTAKYLQNFLNGITYALFDFNRDCTIADVCGLINNENASSP